MLTILATLLGGVFYAYLGWRNAQNKGECFDFEKFATSLGVPLLAGLFFDFYGLNAFPAFFLGFAVKAFWEWILSTAK